MASSTACVSFWLGFLVLELQRCGGLEIFSFDVHHRYSDTVRGVLDLKGLPEEGTVEYYAAMAYRDRVFRDRKLAGTTASAGSTELTFAAGNETYEISSLGYLHYANVSVGSPGLWFLVALDTGSNLFWLPCDCASCLHGSLMSGTQKIDLNMYSPNTSSTSRRASCDNSFCGIEGRCATKHNACIYQVSYLSTDTSSIGILVEDLLHLTTEDGHAKVDAHITFGCGKIQTGSFLNGAAFNGLLGLGMDNISVPTILAKDRLTANSFSMCFGHDVIGRITFGDNGSSAQGETPFNFEQSQPIYNISVTQISVGNNVTELEFSAIFDSGTSFTYLNNPAYSIISDNFNSQAEEKRYQSDSQIPFEYCYELSENQRGVEVPALNLTMKGGSQFFVTRPIEFFTVQTGGSVYCLAVIKSRDINIIGQNFMWGYRIVFDREKMVLGWEASDCFDAKTNTLPINSGNSSSDPPASPVDPEDRQFGARHRSPLSSPSTQLPLPANHSRRLNPLTSALLLLFLSLSLHSSTLQFYH